MGLAMRGATLDVRGSTVGNLMDIFPDVGGWVEKAARHFYGSQSQAKSALVTDFFRRLQYTGKAEHLSMWFCFYANKDLCNANVGAVALRVPQLTQLMLKIRTTTGMWPTPMVLVREATAAGLL